MAPSQEANSVIGALGGAVLAACLAPQLWKLYRTRSARDLSYLYLCMYDAGLLLTFIYLYYEGAFAGWVCVLVELGFGCTMVAAKTWLDHFGPHSPRATQRPKPQAEASADAKLPSSPSPASEVRIDVNACAQGAAACWPGHTSRHLLMRASLALAPPPPQPATVLAEGETGSSAESGTASPAGVAMGSLLGMLEAALLASGLPVLRRYHQAFPKEEAATPDVGLFSCSDGYAMAFFFGSTGELSITFLAASDATALLMGSAAQLFYEQLQAAYAGSRVTASTASWTAPAVGSSSR